MAPARRALQGFELLAIDRRGLYVDLGKDGQTYRVEIPQPRALPAAAGQLPIPEPLSHDEALERMKGFLEAYEKYVASLPNYRALDPAIERRFAGDSEFAADLKKQREDWTKGAVYIAEANGFPWTIRTNSLQSIPFYAALFKNLTPDEWASANATYTKLVAEQTMLKPPPLPPGVQPKGQ